MRVPVLLVGKPNHNRRLYTLASVQKALPVINQEYIPVYLGWPAVKKEIDVIALASEFAIEGDQLYCKITGFKPEYLGDDFVFRTSAAGDIDFGVDGIATVTLVMINSVHLDRLKLK